MIIMNLELDNLFAFEEFKINFSYLKEDILSGIENEFLLTKTNFRYKKVNILMGSNASGKTSIGKAIMAILNFISKKEIEKISPYIKKREETSLFSIDFLVDENYLYRVDCEISAEDKVRVETYSSEILEEDSYEDCVKKLSKYGQEVAEEGRETDYIKKLNSLNNTFGWLFTFPDSEADKAVLLIDDKKILDVQILNLLLKALDNSIEEVIKSQEVENTYIIKIKNEESIIVQNGKIIDKNILSSGTRVGIDIAYILSSMSKNAHGFYYCDEKFSYIQSDLEIAILSLMIEMLNPMAQLFFTTHNLDILEMDIPLHSFNFLKKKEKIEVISPLDYTELDGRTLASAVKNDVFNTVPDVNNIFKIYEVCNNG